MKSGMTASSPWSLVKLSGAPSPPLGSKLTVYCRRMRTVRAPETEAET